MKSNGFPRMTFALVETDLCVKATESVWTAIPLDNGSPKIPVAIRETSIFSYFQRHFERRLRNRMWQLGNSQNKIESSFRAPRITVRDGATRNPGISRTSGCRSRIASGTSFHRHDGKDATYFFSEILTHDIGLQGNKLLPAHPVDSQNFRVLTELNAFRVSDTLLYLSTQYGLTIWHGNKTTAKKGQRVFGENGERQMLIRWKLKAVRDVGSAWLLVLLAMASYARAQSEAELIA
jgi:hypothetical protein